MSRNTIGDLLEACARGDRAAFEILHRAMSPRVHGLCRSMLGAGVAAREVASEVLGEVWERADRYRSERGSGEAWVLAIARNRCLDRLRVIRLRRAREGDIEATSALQAPIDVERAVASREGGARLLRALGRLPPAQRHAIVAVYFLGLSHRQVARWLRLPVGTIKGRIRLGLKKLRRILES